MRKRDIVTFTGVIVGAAGVIALGFLLKKFIANKKVEQFEEDLVAAIVDKSPFHGITQTKKISAKETVVNKIVVKKPNGRKVSVLAVAKLGNAKKLLEFMKKGAEYTQVMLENLSKIPYRSVRRYIDVLTKQGKIIATGYGKGKKFTKK